MKTLSAIALVLVLVGCAKIEDDPKIDEKVMRVVYFDPARGGVYVIEVDGCEYVLYRNQGAGITHKANCKNPEHRSLR